jgi:hypothetical protein
VNADVVAALAAAGALLSGLAAVIGLFLHRRMSTLHARITTQTTILAQLQTQVTQLTNVTALILSNQFGGGGGGGGTHGGGGGGGGGGLGAPGGPGGGVHVNPPKS